MDEKLNNELEALKKELIELKNKSPMKEDDIRLQLYKVGGKSYELGKYDEALRYYEECLEIGKRILPSNHSSIADSLMGIRLVYRNHSSIADTLHNIGSVYDNQGKYEEALKYYNQSLEMKKKTLPSNHPSIAKTLNNIGLLYKDQGKYEIAINYFTGKSFIVKLLFRLLSFLLIKASTTFFIFNLISC